MFWMEKIGGPNEAPEGGPDWGSTFCTDPVCRT